jgi:hypothetical protein
LAGCVVKERVIPNGSVAKGVWSENITIREERLNTDGRVVIVPVVIERVIPNGSVAAG